MPLYNNILSSRRPERAPKGTSEPVEPAKSSPSASGGMKLLQDHLLAKKLAHKQQQATKKLLNRNKLSTNKTQQHDFLYRPPHPLEATSENITDNLQQDYEEEYDPMIPNSYEVVKAEYLKAEKRRLAQLMSSASNKKLSVPNLLDVIDKLDDDNGAGQVHDKNRGTAIAPPSSLSHSVGPVKPSSDEVDSKPLIETKKETTSKSCESPATIAAKIMSKMGYKQGESLGKDTEKLDETLGAKKEAGVKIESTEDVKPTTGIYLGPTRVLLLQNMVGPGEVDQELESETKEECGKYGDVVKCLIYEIPNKRVPDEEAVRIFVEFRQTESAIKAANDLNGRYFGGRIVRTSFYSVEKFNKYELGPAAN